MSRQDREMQTVRVEPPYNVFTVEAIWMSPEMALAMTDNGTRCSGTWCHACSNDGVCSKPEYSQESPPLPPRPPGPHCTTPSLYNAGVFGNLDSAKIEGGIKAMGERFGLVEEERARLKDALGSNEDGDG